jgi:hypothetical protein
MLDRCRGGLNLSCSVIGAVGDPAGGYYAYTACGNVLQVAGATWYGSMTGDITNEVAVEPTADGGGYWLITASGTVYAYGDATGGTSITSNYSLTDGAASPAG